MCAHITLCAEANARSTISRGIDDVRSLPCSKSVVSIKERDNRISMARISHRINCDRCDTPVPREVSPTLDLTDSTVVSSCRPIEL